METIQPYVAVVGNGELSSDCMFFVERADCVVRFNFPSYDSMLGGSKTDILFLSNSGGHILDWIKKQNIKQSIYFEGAKEIILPRHPAVIDRLYPHLRLNDFLHMRKKDCTANALKLLHKLKRRVTVLSEDFNIECHADLGLDITKRSCVIPSTGFMGIKYALQRYRGLQIRLFGFGWQGWEGHPWAVEERWVRSCPRIFVQSERK